MDHIKESVLSALAIITVGLVLGLSIQKCGEYNTRELDVKKACVQAGHTPIECGLVKYQ